MRNLLFNRKIWLTNNSTLGIITFAFSHWMQWNIGRDVVRIKEKYSRGRRGAPAKGVGRVTGARVQIPLSPFSLPDKVRKC